MLVSFESSETGQFVMFAESARLLLQAVGKECTARGVFTQPEMAAAASVLRQAVESAKAVPRVDDKENAEEERAKEPVVALGQRAWPLIDALERTSRAGSDASIVWQAAKDF